MLLKDLGCFLSASVQKVLDWMWKSFHLTFASRGTGEISPDGTAWRGTFAYIINRSDLSLLCSSGLVGRASSVAMDVSLAAVANSLGFGEALNRSCEPFGDPLRESSMIAESNPSKKDLSK